METLEFNMMQPMSMPIKCGCVVFDGKMPIAVTSGELDAFMLVEALHEKWENLNFNYKRIDGKPNSAKEDM